MKTNIKTNPIEDEYNQKGVILVLYEKLCFYLEVKEVKEILNDLFIISGIIFTIYLCFFVENQKELLISCIKYRNYAIFRTAWLLLLILGIKPLLKFLYILYINLRANLKTLQRTHEPCKKNLDLPEFIYKTKSFKLTDAKKFGITQSQYPKIRNELFNASLLERGENNAIVLKNNVSLFQLRNIFSRINSPLPSTEIYFSSNSIKTS